MGRTPLEIKYKERRFNFRSMLQSIMSEYERTREAEIATGDDIFTEIELNRLDTIYYKMANAVEHLVKTAQINGTFVYRGKNGKTFIKPEEEY